MLALLPGVHRANQGMLKSEEGRMRGWCVILAYASTHPRNTKNL